MNAIRFERPLLLLGMLVCLYCAPAFATSHRPVYRAPTAARVAPAATGWTTSACGREPIAPTVDTATVQRYNASIDQVTAYDRSARIYNDCVSRAAVAEQTEISNQAKVRIDAIQQVSAGVQRRIAANFEALGGALKKGVPKLQPASR